MTPPPPSSITLDAPAKINLALAAGPPVPDGPKRGFHPITSWFVTTSLCDRLTLRRLHDDQPSTHTITWAADAPKPSPIDWPIEKDLAVRAHRLLEQHVGRTLPLAMTLSKRIPVGGGLGGGSSDAAAALVGIDALFTLNLGAATLARLSERLGSDVAFFIDEPGMDAPEVRLTPRPAMVTGFGERIERLRRLPLPDALLLVPDFGCPTGAVYKAYDELLARRHGALVVTAGQVTLAAERWQATGVIDDRLLGNSLSVAACAVAPPLERALERLSGGLGVPVHVTGSGSTMFILRSPGADLAALARQVAGEDPTIVCVPVELC